MGRPGWSRAPVENYELLRPPLRPAAFFWAVVPPCFELLRELEPEPDFLPPRLEAPEGFEISAARSFDMPLSFSFSYCFSLLFGIGVSSQFLEISSTSSPVFFSFACS